MIVWHGLTRQFIAYGVCVRAKGAKLTEGHMIHASFFCEFCFVFVHPKSVLNDHTVHATERGVCLARPTLCVCLLWLPPRACTLSSTRAARSHSGGHSRRGWERPSS